MSAKYNIVHCVFIIDAIIFTQLLILLIINSYESSLLLSK